MIFMANAEALAIFAWKGIIMARYVGTTAIFGPLLTVMLAQSASAADAALPQEPAAPATETRETLFPKLRWGDDRHYLEFYAQINKGLLVFDDGGSTLGYFPVDNGNSSSRAGLRGYTTLDEYWSLGANLEWEWNPYSTNNVNQFNRDDFDWETDLLRKAEIYLESEQYGKVWLGQGSMASDNTAEVDLSGTTVVGYSLVADMAGGPFFRLDEGELSSVHVKDAFTNFDGVSRKFRARYDTPSFNGFSLAASVGTQLVPVETDITVWDIAARYDNTFGDYKFAAAVAFSQPNRDEGLYDGSFSILHEPTGLSLTLAAAYSDEEVADGRYGYVKLGYQEDFFEVGKTALSVDAYFGRDIAALDSDSTSFGAQIVQNLDYLQTELYLGVRSYSYDEEIEDFQDSVAMLAGARMKF
ncbi:porin [Mesorhizobium sp. LHD-90]|uniref:porin n=1 Tax=Mesorhizobium sp. LHD-90 TaxID=3071414 RepID=UPI0027E17B57|nr:porin [Mesorhizobium sp. LHD-90]MDQ6436381.1 porin [Mesorhizobium sp. LHD-90]